MIPSSRGRLGRLAPHPDRVAAVPSLALYRSDQQPSREIDWSRDIAPDAWGMYRNDSLSDCTAAAVAHAIGTWQSYVPPLRFLTDQDVVRVYAATGGYMPGEPATDRGAVCLDVLNYWMRNEIGGGTLSAFCAVNPQDLVDVRLALEIFGGLYAGVTLREAQLAGSGVWDATQGALAGGHCVWVVGADPDGLTCITWGAPQRMTWAFWTEAADECYALLSPCWIRGGRTPEGFPVASMIAAMAELAKLRV